MSDFDFDLDRASRAGVGEAIFCAGKSVEQLNAFLGDWTGKGPAIFLTRLSPERAGALKVAPDHSFDYDPISQTAILGSLPVARHAGVVIVTAGTSDVPVATEAARGLAVCGYDSETVKDVGVAGLHRLLGRLDTLREARLIIAVAGMEGALFPVIAGLVRAPVIAVPTSVGYGVTAGGKAALNSALGTCAPGVLTTNIDNGFGAAMAAAKILGIGAADE
ncbi:nickel pincer cofactor biosynthesis protein LarB [Ruegeria hyattellae]|uniref:nickel pincer cofactor biosynthesis protein LarB n=1 Tax=Ruegeria hyattellae TaxID=3233337 RepID=UPI00355B6D2E